ncbi:MAG: methyltransferase domain-containing protein [Verrucomicrobiota bacterium]
MSKIERIKSIELELSSRYGLVSDDPLHAAKSRNLLRRCSAIIRQIEKRIEPGETYQALELGVDTGAMLLCLARVLDNITWSGTDVPNWNASRQSIREEIFKDICAIKPFDANRDRLPYDDAMFDFVLCSEMLEHLPANSVLPLLREMYRVLKPGGVLLATSPNLTSLMNRLLMLAGANPLHLPIPEEQNGFQTFPHIQLYTPDNMIELGTHAGFRAGEKQYLTYLAYTFFEPGARWRNQVLRAYLFLDRLITPLVPALRDGWLVALNKDPSRDEAA